jgi:hypothetical protein
VKLKPVANDAGVIAGYAFYCPGCTHTHVFYIAGKMTWEFNGNFELPSFNPSLRNTSEKHADPKQRGCHLVLTEGRIHYQPDCTHDLAGQVVDLPDWPYGC